MSSPPLVIGPLAPVPADVFRETCAHFATGVSVATTCASDGSPHGLTVSSFTPVSLNPPLVLICVDFASSTHETFSLSPVFSINILAEEQKSLSVHFAQSPEGGFDQVAWSAGATGAPVLAGVLASIECAVVNRLDAGDHTIVIGEVIAAGSRDGKPLVYFERDYRRLDLE